MKKLGSILVALLLGCVLATQVQAADINFTPSIEAGSTNCHTILSV